jgi:hypothetical protein
MSLQGNSWPVSLPLRASLVLILCTCSLLAHFIVEGLGSADEQPKYDLTSQEGVTHLIQENCVDDLVFSSPTDSDIEYTPTLPFSQVPVSHRSVLISPLLPPPNF